MNGLLSGMKTKECKKTLQAQTYRNGYNGSGIKCFILSRETFYPAAAANVLNKMTGWDGKKEEGEKLIRNEKKERHFSHLHYFL